MDTLPIDAALPAIRDAAASGAFVVVAPPGTGKTTRVPGALLDRVSGSIVMLEPRRIAARAAARRIAAERREKVGETVGYQVRYERVGGARTRIWAVTDGVLLRRLQDDPLLEGVGAVLLDEVHERGLEVDLALSLLAEVREARPDLVVGAMSATVDADPIARFLGGAPIVRAEAPRFPVAESYLPYPDDRPIEDLAADAIRALSRPGGGPSGDPGGDVLVFLPGVGEIRRTAERLRDHPAQIVLLYGDLSPEEQDRALSPGSGRRVILATNVAETSVTVPGVTVVVDSGLARRPRLDPATGLDHLDTVRISRASADQRAGRAGRLGPGRVVRLWTEREHRAREPFDVPEVQRVDLCGPMLQLCAWGADPRRFRWLDPPPPEAVDAALATLEALGALDQGALTPIGRRLSALPLHPRLGRLLVEGARLGHTADAARLAALLAERDPLRGRVPTHTSPSDLLDRLDALPTLDPAVRRNVQRAADQLVRLAPAADDRVERDEALLRAVLAGWPDRVARRRAAGSDRARMVGGKGVRLDRCSAVTGEELFVAVDAEADGADARVRLASAVRPEWLVLHETRELGFDEDHGLVRARRSVWYRDLELGSHPAPVEPGEAAPVLARVAAERLDRVRPEAAEALQARLDFLAALDPSWAVDWTEVLPGLCEGCRGLGDLRGQDWVGAVRDHLGWSRWSELERLAPERIEVPSGSRIALRYEAGGPPVLAVRIQELFGSTDTPKVAGGKVRVKLHLLAPNGRPQQITDDLAGFWERTWPEVRKELRARYPKHAWPEDPKVAPPESRPGRSRRVER